MPHMEENLENITSVETVEKQHYEPVKFVFKKCSSTVGHWKGAHSVYIQRATKRITVTYL